MTLLGFVMLLFFVGFYRSCALFLHGSTSGFSVVLVWFDFITLVQTRQL